MYNNIIYIVFCLLIVACNSTGGGAIECPSEIYDCAGNCDGQLIEDCAGECGGGATEDCEGTCDGLALKDECGTCNGSGLNEDGCCGDETTDCAGECNGSAIVDDCGECNGPGPCNGKCLWYTPLGSEMCPMENMAYLISEHVCIEITTWDDCVLDCSGEWNGGAIEDECGVCDGDGISDGECDCNGNVEDCTGVCGGNALENECGECDILLSFSLRDKNPNSSTYGQFVGPDYFCNTVRLFYFSNNPT